MHNQRVALGTALYLQMVLMASTNCRQRAYFMGSLLGLVPWASTCMHGRGGRGLSVGHACVMAALLEYLIDGVLIECVRAKSIHSFGRESDESTYRVEICRPLGVRFPSRR